jgi:hypothetical protein
MDGEDVMPRTGKNDERTEQVPRGNRKITKVEPLHQLVETIDKNYNGLSRYTANQGFSTAGYRFYGFKLKRNKF